MALAIEASKSLARRRLRLSRAGTFDHPATGKHDEAGSVSFDDLDGPAAELGENFGQFVPGIGTISEEVAQPGEEIVNGLDNDRRAIAVLEFSSRVELGADQEATRIGDDMALAPLDLFAGVIPARAAALGGLDGLTVDDPGRGLASRPAASRVSTNNSKLIRCKTPLSRQA